MGRSLELNYEMLRKLPRLIKAFMSQKNLNSETSKDEQDEKSKE